MNPGTFQNCACLLVDGGVIRRIMKGGGLLSEAEPFSISYDFHNNNSVANLFLALHKKKETHFFLFLHGVWLLQTEKTNSASASPVLI